MTVLCYKPTEDACLLKQTERSVASWQVSSLEYNFTIDR